MAVPSDTIPEMSKQKVRTQTRQLVQEFALQMSAAESEAHAFTGESGFRAGRLPSDPDRWLAITQETYRSFELAVNALSVDPSLQHLSRQEIDASLWDFGMRIAEGSQSRSWPPNGINATSQYLASLARDSVEWEVLVEVDHLSVSDEPLHIDSVLVTKVQEELVQHWLSKRDSHVFADELMALRNGTAAVVRVWADDSARAIELARERTDEALGQFRFALVHANPFNLPDQQLLFRRGRRAWAALVLDRDHWGSSVQLGFRPVALELTSDVQARTQASLDLLESLRASRAHRKVQDRLMRAAYWIGLSASQELFDHKVVALCTAAECFLATKSDGRKGEVIVLRSLLLSIAMGTELPQPTMLYELYEKRSAVVHGSETDVCGEHEYKWLRLVVGALLDHAIKFAIANGSTSVDAFLGALEKDGAVENVLRRLEMSPAPEVRRLAGKIRSAGLGPRLRWWSRLW